MDNVLRECDKGNMSFLLILDALAGFHTVDFGILDCFWEVMVLLYSFYSVHHAF